MVFHSLSPVFQDGMNWQLEVHISSDCLTEVKTTLEVQVQLQHVCSKSTYIQPF